eukprot:5459830-Pyramimonas_sp.AAC.1
MKQGEEVESRQATFMDDVTRAHARLGTPSLQETIFKINYATRSLEDHAAEGGHVLNAGKTHHLVSIRGIGAQATTSRLHKKSDGVQ